MREAMLAVSGTLDQTQAAPPTRNLQSHRRHPIPDDGALDRSNLPHAVRCRRSEQPSSISEAMSTVAPQALFLMNHAFVLDRRLLGPDEHAQGASGKRRRDQQSNGSTTCSSPPPERDRNRNANSVDAPRHEVAWSDYCSGAAVHQ